MHRGRRQQRGGDGGLSLSTTTIDGGWQKDQPHHLHISGTGTDAGTVELIIIEDQVVVLGELWRGRHPNDTRSGVMIKFISRAEQIGAGQSRPDIDTWDGMK